MSDYQILREIGRRLKRKRLEKNMTQQKIADITGLDRTTVGKVEQGTPFGVLTLVQILRGLEALEEIDAFLPEAGFSPLELARMKGMERKRASSQKPTGNKGGADW